MKGRWLLVGLILVLLGANLVQYQLYQRETRTFRALITWQTELAGGSILGASDALAEVQSPGGLADDGWMAVAASKLDTAFHALSVLTYAQRTADAPRYSLLRDQVHTAQIALDEMLRQKAYQPFEMVRTRLRGIAEQLPAKPGPDYRERFDRALTQLVLPPPTAPTD